VLLVSSGERKNWTRLLCKGRRVGFMSCPFPLGDLDYPSNNNNNNNNNVIHRDHMLARVKKVIIIMIINTNNKPTFQTRQLTEICHKARQRRQSRNGQQNSTDFSSISLNCEVTESRIWIAEQKPRLTPVRAANQLGRVCRNHRCNQRTDHATRSVVATARI